LKLIQPAAAPEKERRIPYTLPDGTRVPSVTTVIGRFKQADPLIRWAVKETREGRNYEETRDKAASAGTLAHTFVECHICGRNRPDTSGYDPETVAKATRSFDAFMGWLNTIRADFIWTERRLVSQRYRVGGTPDAYGFITGRRSLIDWKTSGAIYGDYLIQLAAYALMIEESEGEAPEMHYICRFDKTTADFSFYSYTDLSDAKRQFILYREAYDLDAKLRKQAK